MDGGQSEKIVDKDKGSPNSSTDATIHNQEHEMINNNYNNTNGVNNIITKNKHDNVTSSNTSTTIKDRIILHDNRLMTTSDIVATATMNNNNNNNNELSTNNIIEEESDENIVYNSSVVADNNGGGGIVGSSGDDDDDDVGGLGPLDNSFDDSFNLIGDDDFGNNNNSNNNNIHQRLQQQHQQHLVANNNNHDRSGDQMQLSKFNSTNGHHNINYGQQHLQQHHQQLQQQQHGDYSEQLKQYAYNAVALGGFGGGASASASNNDNHSNPHEQYDDQRGYTNSTNNNDGTSNSTGAVVTGKNNTTLPFRQSHMIHLDNITPPHNIHGPHLLFAQQQQQLLQYPESNDMSAVSSLTSAHNPYNDIGGATASNMMMNGGGHIPDKYSSLDSQASALMGEFLANYHNQMGGLGGIAASPIAASSSSNMMIGGPTVTMSSSASTATSTGSRLAGVVPPQAFLTTTGSTTEAESNGDDPTGTTAAASSSSTGAGTTGGTGADTSAAANSATSSTRGTNNNTSNNASGEATGSTTNQTPVYMGMGVLRRFFPSSTSAKKAVLERQQKQLKEQQQHEQRQTEGEEEEVRGNNHQSSDGYGTIGHSNSNTSSNSHQQHRYTESTVSIPMVYSDDTADEDDSQQQSQNPHHQFPTGTLRRGTSSSNRASSGGYTPSGDISDIEEEDEQDGHSGGNGSNGNYRGFGGGGGGAGGGGGGGNDDLKLNPSFDPSRSGENNANNMLRQRRDVGNDENMMFHNYNDNDYNDGDNDDDADDDGQFKVYWQRWVMLFYMSMLNLLSDWTCYSVAPISVLTNEAFGEIQPTVLVTVFLGANAISTALEPGILSRLGLRGTIVLGSLLMLLGSLTKSGIPFIHPIQPGEPNQAWKVYMGFFLVGLSQPLYQCTPALLSNSWFPEKERTMATGVALNSNQLGIGFAFVFGTLLVGRAEDIPAYFSLMSIISLLLLIGTLFQFDDAPPTPPSGSAKIIRGTFSIPVPRFFQTRPINNRSGSRRSSGNNGNSSHERTRSVSNSSSTHRNNGSDTAAAKTSLFRTTSRESRSSTPPIVSSSVVSNTSSGKAKESPDHPGSTNSSHYRNSGLDPTTGSSIADNSSSNAVVADGIPRQRINAPSNAPTDPEDSVQQMLLQQQQQQQHSEGAMAAAAAIGGGEAQGHTSSATNNGAPGMIPAGATTSTGAPSHFYPAPASSSLHPSPYGYPLYPANASTNPQMAAAAPPPPQFVGGVPGPYPPPMPNNAGQMPFWSQPLPGNGMPYSYQNPPQPTMGSSAPAPALYPPPASAESTQQQQQQQIQSHPPYHYAYPPNMMGILPGTNYPGPVPPYPYYLPYGTGTQQQHPPPPYVAAAAANTYYQHQIPLSHGMERLPPSMMDGMRGGGSGDESGHDTYGGDYDYDYDDPATRQYLARYLPPGMYSFDEGAEPIEIVSPHHVTIECRDDQILLSAKACFSRPGFTQSCVAFVVSAIVINTLSTDMDYLVRLGGAGREYVGIIGGLFQLLIMLSSLVVGTYTDKTRTYYTVVIVMLVLGAFALAQCGVRLDQDKGGELRMTLLVVAVLVGPLQPVATELGVDVAYPLSENTVLVIQQFFANLLSAVFIQFFDMAKDIGTNVLNEETGTPRPEYTFSFYLLIVLHACGTVFFATFNGRYLRYEAEEAKKIMKRQQQAAMKMQQQQQRLLLQGENIIGQGQQTFLPSSHLMPMEPHEGQPLLSEHQVL